MTDMNQSLTGYEDSDDVLFREALRAIAEIEPRPWPEGAPLTTIHESFESDIKLVNLFCRDRRVFGRSRRYVEKNWEGVLFLSSPVFLYYLPTVLLAMIEHPRGKLADILLDGRLVREADRYTLAERTSMTAVERVLARAGVTRASIRASIEEGRRRSLEMGYKVPERRRDASLPAACTNDVGEEGVI